MYKKFTRFFCTPPGYIHKFLLIMKLTTFILLVTLMQVSAAGFAQKITLNAHNVPLEQVFKDIRKQSGYDFIYTGKLISKANPVTIQLKDASIEDALKECFADQPLDYTIDQKTVIIKEKQPTQQTAPQPPKDVTGHVADKQGVPLVSATVLIKRTKTGTLTDVKGNFTVKDVLPDDILIISYIGYKPASINVGNQTVLSVVMEETNNSLDQVVVQAYGTTSQRLNTGNIATVTAKQIETHPVMNVLDALQGQVPGVIVQQTSGYASAPFKVEIRGRTGINPDLPSDPLYIIDGVPLTILNLNGTQSGTYSTGSTGFVQNGFNGPAAGQSPFFSINPNDIESLTVLKDADATAIYGSRGANGVIIITTKKGKAGKTKFDFNIYDGVSETTGNYDLLNLQQYLTVRREAFKNDGISPDPGSAYDLLVWDTKRSSDFQKLAFGGLGRTSDIEASLSGGDKLTTFRVSGDYHHQTSPLNYSGADQRASVQFNLTHKSLNQRLSLSFTNLYSYSESNLISLNNSILLPPDAPSGIFDSSGHLNYRAWDPIAYQFPYANVLQPYDAKTLFLNSQLTLQYELLKGLNFSTNLGYSNQHLSQLQITPIASQDPLTNPFGGSEFGNNNGSRAIIEPQLEYKTRLGKGQFSILLGGSDQIVSQDGNTIQGYGYVNDALLGSVSNAPKKDANDGSGQYKYAAIFGRINYNWEDKYIVNLSARRDGSSRFGPGKQFGNFGAIGAAWIFTQESFFKDNVKFLSFGKLRGSYGTTGSDQVGEYQYLTQWTSANVPYNSGVPAYIPKILANPDFRWEVNKKLELALDLGFFEDRLYIEGSFYRNRSDNQLVPFPVPIITGFTSVTANSPANVQNEGWELTARIKAIESKDFNLSFNLNAGRNSNKLLSYPNLAQSPYAYRFVVGMPLNITPMLHYTGVNPQTGYYTFQDRNKNGFIEDSYPPGGDFYYKELNIKLDGGAGIDMSYKGLQLNLFFTIRDDPYVPSANLNGNPGSIQNQTVAVLDRWQKPGDIAKFARYSTLGNNGSYNFYESDGIYVNGSYIRLKNLSLSYALPESFIKKAGIQSCKIYFRGENLFILTKYDGLDPDTPSASILPPSKVFTLGLQFNL
jgi:TonB-linked SusC/RagA family outer membrane protein